MGIKSQFDAVLSGVLARFFALLGTLAAALPFLTGIHWAFCLVTALLTLGGAGCHQFKRVTRKTVLKPDVFQEFKLERKTIVSHNVTIYRFELPTTQSILGLPIGQHISIGASVKQPDGSSKEVVRSYTPISGDEQPGSFDLLIKTYPEGNVTQFLASLAIGQPIRVRGPKGAFTYTPNMVRRFGMIAGGTGITPMLQIMNAVARGRFSGDVTEIDLIFANVTTEDILLKKELDTLAQDADIRVRYVLDKPPQGWKGGVGYITVDMITQWLPAPSPDVKILLCGPPPMVGALRKMTEHLGYHKAQPVSKKEDQVFSF
ncbi:hypothetical protein PCL_01560 [Purpureocillium lilacinum]|uniref:NADH-cytochrome b5 reductase n=1 Tax=Purpureocillium lilacinum TaxID=33203 RepID=A0A2U3E3U0_PURLI|nr:hypothetical protein PCL_01560 [Purpureocillium lilacinum]